MPYAFNNLDLIGEAIKHPPFGLITDVDGTISQTAPTPQEAKISPLCRHYLSILYNHLTLVAVVSGRPATEVKNLVGIDGVVYIGNHGLERWAEDHSEYLEGVRDYSMVIEAVIEELTTLLPMEGIRIEDKGITATIHYRLCQNHKSAENHILNALASLSQVKSLRIIQNRMAIDLLPPVETNKGTATLGLIREYSLQGSVYLGDDMTDIDAFKAMRIASRNSDFRGFAIGIASKEMPDKLIAEAAFTLNGVTDVERFLHWMSQTVLGLG